MRINGVGPRQEATPRIAQKYVDRERADFINGRLIEKDTAVGICKHETDTVGGETGISFISEKRRPIGLIGEKPFSLLDLNFH